jgi:YD repeat-containing protein
LRTTLGAAQTQNLSYGWDGLGNLTSRSDGAKTETFGYDQLNRLKQRNGGEIVGYTDSGNGNILWKLDVAGVDSRSGGNGDYQYGSSRPHAVTSAWGFAMTYDANGNLVTREKPSTGERWSVQMAGFDKPRWMGQADGGQADGAKPMGSNFALCTRREVN